MGEPINQYPPAVQDLKIKRGQSMSLSFNFSYLSNPLDWTGWVFTAQVRRTLIETSPLIATLTATSPTPGNGSVLLAISADDSDDIAEASYFYDVKAVNGNQTRWILEGVFLVEGRVTHE